MRKKKKMSPEQQLRLDAIERFMILNGDLEFRGPYQGKNNPAISHMNCEQLTTLINDLAKVIPK